MRVGILTKLVAVSVVIVVVVSFGFAVLNVALSNHLVEEDLRARAIAFAREIAATIGDRRELESGALLDRQIANIVEARGNVLQLDILAMRGRSSSVVASSHAERRVPFTRREGDQVAGGRIVSRLVNDRNERYWEVMAPVTLDGTVAGAVAAKFSLERADRLAARVRTRALALTAVSAVLMAVLMGVAVQLIVNRPLRRFIETTDRVREGEGDAVVVIDSRDEFATLAERFNAMLGRVRRFSDDLRAQVAEATAELNVRYREVQRLNEQLFRLQRELARSERLALAGRVVAEIAHEVGTPLHSIAGHLELLRAELPDGVRAGALRRRLDIVDSQVARLTEIIARLLDVTRQPAGGATPVNVSALVDETLAVVEPTFAGAGIALVPVPAAPAAVVHGQRTQLQQVVMNLLSNALQATPRGGRVQVSVRQTGGRETVIEVADTGRGIPPADRKRIFEPFFTRRDEGGTGLGLFVVDVLVRQHGGYVDVESEEGRGTTFRVVLPSATEPA